MYSIYVLYVDLFCACNTYYVVQYPTLRTCLPGIYSTLYILVYCRYLYSTHLLTARSYIVQMYRLLSARRRASEIGGGRVLMHILLLQYYSSINYMHCSSMTYLLSQCNYILFYFLLLVIVITFSSLPPWMESCLCSSIKQVGTLGIYNNNTSTHTLYLSTYRVVCLLCIYR